MSRLLIPGLVVLLCLGCENKKAARDEAPARGLAQEQAKKGAAGALAEFEQPERKIIYTAKLELQVASLDDARAKLDTLLTEVKGYVAKSDETGRAGGIRAGTWKLRVPVSAYRTFLNRAKEFGELVNESSDAQDVTEEFVDTEARLKNLTAEEVVLNKLLQEKAQSTADLLAFRQQISGVREQIERLQARLNTLSRLTALTTIDVVMREDKKFVPDSTPTFGTSAGRTFGDSVKTLEDLGKGLVLILIALAPWSPLILLGLWLFRKPIRVVIVGVSGAFRPTPPRRSPPEVPQGSAE
jgi:Domain of unknown function (DUF4349)